MWTKSAFDNRMHIAGQVVLGGYVQTALKFSLVPDIAADGGTFHFDLARVVVVNRVAFGRKDFPLGFVRHCAPETERGVGIRCKQQSDDESEESHYLSLVLGLK